MKYNRTIILTKKDLKSYFQDYRSIGLFIFTTVFLFPLMIYFMYDTQIKTTTHKKSEQITVGVSKDNMEDISNLFKINEKEVKFVESSKKEITDGIDLIMLKDDDKIDLLFDSANTKSVYSLNFVKNFIDTLNKQILQNANINYYNDYSTDIHKPDNKNNFLLSMISYLVVFGIFYGITTVGINIIAKEKASKTFIYLLATPISKTEISISKFLTTFLVGVSSALCSILGIVLVSFFLTKNHSEYTAISLDANSIIKILIQLILIITSVCLLILLISLRSKSVKEANAIATPLNLLIVLGGATLNTLDNSVINNNLISKIPLLNSTIAIEKILTNQNYNSITNLLTNLAMILILIYIYIYSIKKEKYLI